MCQDRQVVVDSKTYDKAVGPGNTVVKARSQQGVPRLTLLLHFHECGRHSQMLRLTHMLPTNCSTAHISQLSSVASGLQKHSPDLSQALSPTVYTVNQYGMLLFLEASFSFSCSWIQRLQLHIQTAPSLFLNYPLSIHLL